jgi:hypothetical protein
MQQIRSVNGQTENEKKCISTEYCPDAIDPILCELGLAYSLGACK